MKVGNSRELLEKEIVSLISLKQEGEYWDFKKVWHERKEDLLHDVICMSNNLCARDAYIIIGIDEENDYQIIDVKNDANRKNTQMLVDFLKDKRFAGGVRPIVLVEQLELSGSTVDIIVIKNSFYTPFYLTEPYDRVRANNIYTRIMDTNTPVDKSADVNHVEYLWKKRFHLNETPIERIRHLIRNPRNWEDSPIEYEMCKFDKESPEFTIRVESDETRNGYEYYLFGQTDTTPNWYLVTLYYFQTALRQYQGLGLDGARCFVIAPSRSFIKTQDGHFCDINYAYFVEDSLRFDLQCFYRTDEGMESDYVYHQFLKGILIFSSEEERSEFETYVSCNKDILHNLVNEQDEKSLPYFEEINGYKTDGFKKQFKDALALKKMLDEFRYANR